MSQAPSLPLFVDAYLGDTTHLSTEEHGAYLLLLMAMWRRGGSIPDDDKDNARMVGLTVTKWRRMKPRLMEFLDAKNGEISQKRLKKEWEFVQKRKQIAITNGAKGGRPPSSENNDLEKPTGFLRDTENGQNENPQKSSLSPAPSLIPVSTAQYSTWEGLEAELRKAAGWERETSPGLLVVGPIAALLEAGADLKLDVLPTVRAKAPKARKRANWTYFVDAITDATRARTAARNGMGTMPKSEPIDPSKFTDRDFENVVMLAKRKGAWYASWGPPDRIPERLIDPELRRIIAQGVVS